MRNVLFYAAVAAVLAGCSDAPGQTDEAAAGEPEAAIGTSVLTQAGAVTAQEDWGRGVTYFAGESAGVTDLLSGMATIDPGREIHPPHKHHEEEFLMVIEGTGEWTVGEESFSAAAGDMLYAAAWDLHGIRNTGDEPLRFVFWKWQAKGVPVPQDPAG